MSSFLEKWQQVSQLVLTHSQQARGCQKQPVGHLPPPKGEHQVAVRMQGYLSHFAYRHPPPRPPLSCTLTSYYVCMAEREDSELGDRAPARPCISSYLQAWAPISSDDLFRTVCRVSHLGDRDNVLLQRRVDLLIVEIIPGQACLCPTMRLGLLTATSSPEHARGRWPRGAGAGRCQPSSHCFHGKKLSSVPTRQPRHPGNWQASFPTRRASQSCPVLPSSPDFPVLPQ